MARRTIASRAWWPDVVTALGLFVAPYVLPALGFSPDTMSRILIFGLFGIGFDLLFGFTGMLSFGQSAFFGTGGFAAAYLLTQTGMTSVILALVIGTVVAAIVGVGVGLIALRRTGIYFAMITVAIAEVFYFLDMSPLSAFTGGENGLPGVPSPTFYLGFATIHIEAGWSMYAFLAVCFLIGMVLARRIIASPVGLVLVAIRDNQLRAAAVGHHVDRYKLLVFTIAAAYAGMAGGLLGVLQSYMPPDAFAFDTSGQLVMQTVIGGLGTLFGPLVGAAVWLYLRDFLQSTLALGAAWKLALGIVFVLLVCFLRRGIIGGFADLAGYFRSRGSSAAPDGEREPESAGMAPTSAGAAAVGEPVPEPAEPIEHGDPILRTENISKRYGGLLANDSIDFTVREGELRGIIGPNGAGKSTFFKMLTCEVAPSSGRILFHDQDITGFGVTRVAQLGLTKSYQVNQLFNRLTVRDNLAIAAAAERRGPFRMDLLRSVRRVDGLQARVDETLGLVNLAHRADALVSELAYGEKRRLEIGLALATAPSLLLLDEPLAGMSPQERVETIRLLRSIRKGRTMVVIDHDMDAIFNLAERITVLQEGRVLVEGTPQEIRDNTAVQEAYLGGMEEA
ncbi:branched-chain amino acid ABC transporter ATP-binding protein/permease [Pararhizobium mangrovi]|uniref:Branched-chain amino acid ABC transporter ATP-binding protein/permease n=1 Tax=Pararhizobium mangrovi TaxID=2590452 RepID=A0A506TXZ6_9HYPH|nr:branched-chain amino acid ABC transporter ATP-binding protein/permease [Pararhizobium mangrovi]TPW26186.1 branched-chain amino acid ABC transporter ATP-binding protein/permease [Pararhizobium mangrovi]